MNNTTESEIINHSGTTCLLSKPVEDGGTAYPFAFDAVHPNEKSWSYRLCSSRDPNAMTNQELAALLAGGVKLRATWEEQVGHPIGWLTIFVPPPAGSGGGAKGHRVKYERGPDIEMNKPIIDKPTPPPPAPPRIKPPEIEMDIF